MKIFNAIFWAVILIIIGLTIILNQMFDWHLNIFAIVFGVFAYLFYIGYFGLSGDFATVPFDIFFAGGALLFFYAGIRGFYRFRGYFVYPTRQRLQPVKGKIFGYRYGEEDGPTETNDNDEQAHDVGA